MPEIGFPIQSLLPEIRASLQIHPRLVLEAPPGAGKTTQVPLALLDANWLGGRKIVMLEPRRVAARAAAGFMAKQLGEVVGETVGYRIRFENKVGADTRIIVVTEGILTRMLQDDPMLEGVGAILFDEFHERHLAGDLGLALALDVQFGLREDLRIVVMSATLDGERLAQFLDAPRLSSAGRSYPVEVAHFPARREEAIEHQAKRAIEHALATHPGDLLVFLPGQREIARVDAALAGMQPMSAPGELRQARHGGRAPESGQDAPTEGKTIPPHRAAAVDAIEVLALHGELPIEQQTRVLQPAADGRRRVVLATNVAESSVTLPGVRVVIDSGLAREPRFDPNSGFARLDVVSISQASADQRVGRAGRVADGFAYRLWPQSQRLEPQRRPEIAQVELASLALELAAWGSDALRFVDAPPQGAVAAARDLLQRLDALDAGNAITPRGRRMLALGTHPRLAAMLLASNEPSRIALACDLAALIEARDPLRSRSDALADRWQALAAFRNGRVGADANRSALAAIDAASKQWRRRLRCNAQPPANVPAHDLGDLLAHAFPDRIAKQHPQDPKRYLLANGRMAKLFDDSAVYGEPWLVASELRFEAKDALLLRAAPVDERHLRQAFAAHFREGDEVRWDATRRALASERIARFDGIVLSSKPAGRVDPARAARALTDAVRDLGLSALPWSESLSQWRVRVQCLRAWMPELGLPDLSDAALLASLDTWLMPAFAGKTRLDALDESALADALKSAVDWSLRQRIDQLAPTRIDVPSGMQRAIAYALDDHGEPASPVLAVKLQELFGLAQTPRIVDGRVPLTIHLLSPGGRPLQVTQDLAGFWERTYPEVRKEMKGRYPRHPWPNDPWNAAATHRAKPRGT
ncbi:ATP-dependent helicase HrpB [Thermomonas carbonis]|uniref:ATP-dependent helicase HrpB n=1 Tax=Thermomonas carbonis TaxID=1463158 RepID=A0A7G9SSY1_9GAMM|nr:ATP-dependent helicase HrpB [Thermomonas carbonis]QNN70956.1 ATP-dependent helicase HrpB [Thermomonas carbonis]GHC03618.1 ATP-dependent helicase HrpB [Thermomonas carbonis]